MVFCLIDHYLWNFTLRVGLFLLNRFGVVLIDSTNKFSLNGLDNDKGPPKGF